MQIRSGRLPKARHRLPEHVEIPEHGMRPLIPEVEFGQIMTD
jgi:hypothetical protein